MVLLAEKVPLLAEVVSGGPLPDPWHSEFNGCVKCAEPTVWGLLLKSGNHVPMCSTCQDSFLQRGTVKYDVVDTAEGMVDYLALGDSKMRARFVLYSGATLGLATKAALRLVHYGWKDLTVVRVVTTADRERNISPEFTYRDGRVRRASAPV